MIVGVPREMKPDEYRVAMLPSGVEELVRNGHHVLIERGAVLASGITDEQYSVNGAELVDGPTAIFCAAELIVKVKEPLAAACAADIGFAHAVNRHGDRVTNQAVAETFAMPFEAFRP